MKVNLKYLSFFILLSSFILSNSHESRVFNGKYMTDKDGIVTMPINILGHVNSPGTYFLYDGIDLMSALAFAGGYKVGANIKKIKIYKINGEIEFININEVHLYDNKFSLDPNDTIYIDEKRMSRFFYSSNLPSVFLSFINILLTIQNTD